MRPQGVGLDLVELRDFRRRADRPGFLERILSPEELRRLPATEPARRFALAACCFAYKEAVLKALGTGAWQQGTTFRDVRVSPGRDPAAPPTVTLADAALRVFEAAGGGTFELRHAADEERVWASCVWVAPDPA